MKQPSGRYVVTVQAQPFRKGRHYYWIVYWEHNTDELVSWGNAPTQELAEMAALIEVTNLHSGLSRDGQVASMCYSGIHHC